MTNLFLALALLFAACSPSQVAEKTATTLDANKVLVVYLSRTKNTKAVAEMIHQKTGGRLVALELEKPYPENYAAIVKQVANENESGYLPPLKTTIDSIENYEVIFIGFPTWGMQLPPPIKSFLKQYNLSGKTVVPFNTNAGYGIGNSFETIKALCPNSKILEGYTTNGGVERDGIYYVTEGEKRKQTIEEVSKWLQRLNLQAK